MRHQLPLTLPLTIPLPTIPHPITATHGEQHNPQIQVVVLRQKNRHPGLLPLHSPRLKLTQPHLEAEQRVLLAPREQGLAAGPGVIAVEGG